MKRCPVRGDFFGVSIARAQHVLACHYVAVAQIAGGLRIITNGHRVSADLCLRKTETPRPQGTEVLVWLPLSPPCGGASWKVCQTSEPTSSNGSERDRGERETASPSARSYSGFRLTPSSGRCSPWGAKPEKSKACLRVAWFPTFPSYSSWLVQVYQRQRHMSSGLAWEGDFPTHAPHKGTLFHPLVETQGLSNPGFCNNSFSHSNP